MKKKTRFICLSGIDGSGKTTCAKILVWQFQQQEIPVKYVWLHPKPLLLAPLRFLAHRTVLKGENILADYDSYHEKRQQYANKRQFLRKFYYSIMLLDYLLLVYWCLWPYLIRRSSIICDRYIYDLAINLGEILGYSIQEEIGFIRELQRFFPKPDLVIVCDVDEATALVRKSDTPHLSMLTVQRPAYRTIAEVFHFPILDTSAQLDAVANQLCQIVDSHTKGAKKD